MIVLKEADKTVQDSQGAADQAVDSLLKAFQTISDSRKARGVRYPHASILALCVVAFLCGRQNLTAVMRFARLHPELLKALGFPRKTAPSVPTLSRVLGGVNVAQFQRATASWFRGLVDTERKRRRCGVAAVDGKTSCASGVHVLNVFLHDVAQVIWQTPVDKKKNETAAFKESLDHLFAAYPFLRVVTGDALFAGVPLCGMLIERGRHYVFQVKADQPHLLEKMKLVFSPQLHGDLDPSRADGEKKKGLRGRS